MQKEGLNITFLHFSAVTPQKTGRLDSRSDFIGPLHTGEVKATSDAFASMSQEADLNP